MGQSATSERKAMMWGKRRENGIWRAQVRRQRFMWRGHDSLFIALGRWRLRLMKPGRS